MLVRVLSKGSLVLEYDISDGALFEVSGCITALILALASRQSANNARNSKNLACYSAGSFNINSPNHRFQVPFPLFSGFL